jgi:hypothetical protein
MAHAAAAVPYQSDAETGEHGRVPVIGDHLHEEE